MITKNNTILVFDLDDTLYKEIDFLKSAYIEISNFLAKNLEVPSELIFSEMLNYYYNGLNVFECLINKYHIKNVKTEDLINIYRQHKPQIYLESDIRKCIFNLKAQVFKVGLITDGRSMQQRNKLSALLLNDFFDDVIISEEFGSEKPNINNFRYFVDKYGAMKNYIYIGDNTKKDFVAPNKLGWNTICLLDNGNNIHKQSFDVAKNKRPKQLITHLLEIEIALSKLISA